MQSLLPNTRQPRDQHTFFLVILTILLVWLWFQPPNNKKVDVGQPIVQAEQEQKKEGSVQNNTTSIAESTQDASAQDIVETDVPTGWVTLGSMNPDSPYQMLITLTNQGAVPCRIELNTSKYRDVQELSGYLGQIVADQTLAEETGDGVTVQVVGNGTPAEKFGLKVSDKIVQIIFQNRSARKEETLEVQTLTDLRNALENTKPGDFVTMTVVRNGNRIDQKVQLGQYPIDIVRPESAPKDYEEYRQMGGLRGVEKDSDPLSFLTTLQQVDELALGLPEFLKADNSHLKGMIPLHPDLDKELEGVALRKENWEIVSQSEDEAVFRRAVPQWNLEVIKTYKLQKKAPTPQHPVGAGYELTLNITIKNSDTKPHKVAYQLDGPTGLPLEGGWYALKMGPEWGTYGIRDLVVKLQGNRSRTVSHNVIHADKFDNPWLDVSPEYIGVDSRFFQCTLKPGTEESLAEKPWHSKIFPIRVGVKNKDWVRLTDVSYRMWSVASELQAGEKIDHTYTIFAGPKDTAVLEEYGLDETISYGWFWFVAIPLLWILHTFNGLGLSYAMAIIALTICVRLILFPLSIKQAVGAIKMQKIQPELKALAEKYKDDLQARSRAQSELFKKHGYHPLSGCLPLFIQLPIFIGLYKALSIDSGLYGTPLFSSSMRWCSDLSAPDMLFDWSSFWNGLGWSSFNMGQGVLALGPYFNLLPLLTVVLFLVQMVFTMPPPTDEQSRMQRKMMQFMMIFMGLFFFKVPSGLCLYFIVSTVWGLLERRFIPKAKPIAVDNVIDIPSHDIKQNDKKALPTKKDGKVRKESSDAKPEGRLAKWWREVLEKAAEQQKLGQQNKDKDKGDKNRERKKRR